jgi:sensor histidine kinase YesM
VITRSILWSEIKLHALFLTLSVVQAWFMCGSCRTIRSYVLVVMFTFFMWIFLWRGNSFLSNYISTKIPWLYYPGRRFIVGLISTILYTFLAIFLLMTVFEYFFDFNFGSGYGFTILLSIGVTLLISLFLHCREFLQSWREASLESERFQKESISARYETLKNQVNPAFLFHSLRTLSGLVYEEEEKAVKYIKRLSDVYRYILDTRELEIVPVKDEIAFLKSYRFLVETRYGVSFSIDVATDTADNFLPPLALHMIIEHVLRPLHDAEVVNRYIEVLDNGQHIELRHNFALTDPANQIDYLNILEDIRKRFAFLTMEPVVVDESEGKCVIRLPMIRR